MYQGLVELDEFIPWYRRRGITAVFRRHDADSSNSIDAKELQSVMSALGVTQTEEERAAMLKELDTDQSGSVSLEEFLRWFDTYDLHQEFSRYDGDKSGSINRQVIRMPHVIPHTPCALLMTRSPHHLTPSPPHRLTAYLISSSVTLCTAHARREFLKLTQTLGLKLTKKERDVVFSRLDADKMGTITFDEYA